MTIWLTSDTHLSHALVANQRGFSSLKQHDEAILRNLQRHIKSDDILWILGDVAMGGWRDSIVQLSILPFQVRVILGNHDRPSPIMSNHSAYLEEFTTLGGFSSVTTWEFIEFEGQYFMMSHYPHSGDHEQPDRYTSQRPADQGIPIIHGHTHSSEKVTYTRKGTKQLHVGLDAWGLHPVRLETIANLYKEQS